MSCDLQSNQKRIIRSTADTWEELTRIKRNAIEDPLAFRNIEPDPHRTVRSFRDLVAFIKSRPQRAEDKRGTTRPAKSPKSHGKNEQLSKRTMKIAQINGLNLKTPRVVLRDIMQWEECPGKLKGKKSKVTCELAGVITTRYYRANRKFAPSKTGFCSSCHVDVGNFRFHRKNYHTTGWTCQICHDGVVFYKESFARQHLLKYHGLCERPNESNMSQISTKTIRAPMMQCPICGYFFGRLKKHLLYHEEMIRRDNSGFATSAQTIVKLPKGTSDKSNFSLRLSKFGFCSVCGFVVTSIWAHRVGFHTVGWKCRICLDDAFFYTHAAARRHLKRQHNRDNVEVNMTKVSTQSVPAILKQCPKCNCFCPKLKGHACFPGIAVNGGLQMRSTMRHEISLQEMVEYNTESSALGDMTASKTESVFMEDITASETKSLALGDMTASKTESVFMEDITASETKSSALGDMTASKTESVFMEDITASKTKSSALGDMTASKTDSVAFRDITEFKTELGALGDTTASKTDSDALEMHVEYNSDFDMSNVQTSASEFSLSLQKSDCMVDFGEKSKSDGVDYENFQVTPFGASKKTYFSKIWKNNNPIRNRGRIKHADETELDSVLASDSRGLSILSKKSRILDCGCSTANMHRTSSAFLHEMLRYRCKESSEVFCSTVAKNMHGSKFHSKFTPVERKSGAKFSTTPRFNDDGLSIGLAKSAQAQEEVFKSIENEKCAECDRTQLHTYHKLLHRLWRYQCLHCCQIFCHSNFVKHLRQHNIGNSKVLTEHSRIVYRNDA